MDAPKESRQTSRTLIRGLAVWCLLLAGGLAFFIYQTEKNPDSRFHFRLGLDLTGGTHLVYKADVSALPPEEASASMEALRNVIENRVNLFGVSEPLVQLERSSAFSEGPPEERLVVELPGVTDIDEAIRLIGRTPLLEFKLFDETVAAQTATSGVPLPDPYIDVGFTGRFIERAMLSFRSVGGSGVGNEPIIVVRFSSEGRERFATLTSENVGRQLAIFLDGELLSQPVIQEAITQGEATISGSFTPQSARELVRDLNFGALPVPITLISTQSIGPSLGENTLSQGVVAGMWGLALVAAFLSLWYRIPGVVAILALAVYAIITLVLYKLIPVTLTAAGVAGAILSIGMAVDANILVFERIREEFAHGKKIEQAIRDGFARAWLPIRDGNLTTIFTAIILFWFGTSLLKGFALTLALGILVSMFTALSITRVLLLASVMTNNESMIRILYGHGFKS